MAVYALSGSCTFLLASLAVNMGALQSISTSAFLIVIMSQLGISANCMKLCHCQPVIPCTIYHTTWNGKSSLTLQFLLVCNQIHGHFFPKFLWFYASNCQLCFKDDHWYIWRIIKSHLMSIEHNLGTSNEAFTKGLSSFKEEEKIVHTVGIRLTARLIALGELVCF